MKSVFKFLQVGFVAICAVVAMSFTVADHTGALNKIASIGKHRASYTCDNGINDFSAAKDITTGTSYNATSGTGVTCGTPPSGDCYNTFTSPSAAVCDDTANFVCCFTKTSTTCSVGVPPTSGNKVTIHCNSVKP